MTIQQLRLFYPGQYENEKKFICDDSAQFWRDYNSNGEYKTEDFVAVATDVSKRFFSKGDDAWSYWLRHTARSGYFVSTAALGFVASRLHDQLLSKQKSVHGRRGGLASKFASDVPHLMAEAALTYEKDYQCILEGKYKLPYDMYTRNRQNNPLYFGEKTARFIRDAVGTMSRIDQGLEKDKRIWLNADADGIYPDYYKHAFHYQKDGWMSQNSADIYETSTESLFLGRQDAMQRTALVPLLEFVNGNSDNVKKSSGDKKPLKVLEVGCGTGRFLTFVRDNLPLDAECTAVDLSPFYLNNARDNDKNWMSVRRRVEASHGNVSVKIAPASFVQAKGEDLPFDDEVFDVVLCMYVYHEVPRDIRGQIASEMARVTKKGGRVILTDSIQKGDRPCLDSFLGLFGSMNEPYYEDYIEDHLPNHFESAGLECSTKTVRSNSKSLAFKKPDKLEPVLEVMTDMFFNEANLA